MRVDLMFDPIFAELGPFQLGWHGLFTMLAVMAGLWLGLRRAERSGFEEQQLSRVVTFGIIGAVAGARLFHVLDHWPTYLANPLAVLAIWEGGIAVYGAFIGAILAGLLAARRAGLPVWPLLGAAGPAMLLGQAVGRLGCLSNGDAWGAPTGTDWGIVYLHPNAHLPPDLLGVPTHPYPFYEILASLVLLGALWLARERLQRPGLVFLLSALGYAAIRFSLTVFRQESPVLWGLQQAQVVALLTAAAALVGVLLLPRLSHSPERTVGSTAS